MDKLNFSIELEKLLSEKSVELLISIKNAISDFELRLDGLGICLGHSWFENEVNLNAAIELKKLIRTDLVPLVHFNSLFNEWLDQKKKEGVRINSHNVDLPFKLEEYSLAGLINEVYKRKYFALKANAREKIKGLSYREIGQVLDIDPFEVFKALNSRDMPERISFYKRLVNQM
ncbi:hypothetical protein [Halobacteriovorax sp. CON-3]|uniref:hypothetical protein n=1 Tax=Halobacteriovorax sp. CON-3 TaxID=3157710 RepID=UPI00371A70A8